MVLRFWVPEASSFAFAYAVPGEDGLRWELFDLGDLYGIAKYVRWRMSVDHHTVESCSWSQGCLPCQR